MSEANTQGEIAVKEGLLFWKHEKSTNAVASSRPTLLFLHAGVADHTLWDAQVLHFRSEWNCLRCDRFGFGQSQPSQQFLQTKPRPEVDHVEHVKQLLQHVLPPNEQIVVIGLSMGGNLAAEFAYVHPQMVCGLAILAGGVPGFGVDNQPEEDALFAEHERLIGEGSIQAAAELEVRIWGDGPLQRPGRMDAAQAKRLLAWTLDIDARESSKSGGKTMAAVDHKPIMQDIRVPTALAWGVFDETYTTAGMKQIAEAMPNAYTKEFQTAHMINMEAEEEFNAWLDGWLKANFVK